MVEYFFGRPDFIFGSNSNSSPGQLNHPRPALLDLELSSPGGDHHPEAATVVKVWHSTATHIRWGRFKWCSVFLKLSNTTLKFATCTLGNDRNRVLTKRSFCKHKRDTAFLKLTLHHINRLEAQHYNVARGTWSSRAIMLYVAWHWRIRSVLNHGIHLRGVTFSDRRPNTRKSRNDDWNKLYPQVQCII